MHTLFTRQGGKMASPIFNERGIEFPWLLKNVKKGKTIDIGSYDALYIRYLYHFVGEEKIVRVDLPDRAIEPDNYSIVINKDIRELTTDEIGTFENVILLSTLEHMGVAKYGKDTLPQNPFSIQYEIYLHCWQFVSPTGRMLLTLPFGKYTHGGWIIVYDAGMVDKLKEGFKVISEDYFMIASEKNNYKKVMDREILKNCTLEHYEYSGSKRIRAQGVVCLALERQTE